MNHENNSSKYMQVFGLVCPLTGKIRFVEIAKNAADAYENFILRAAQIFKDPLSQWIDTLTKLGTIPGFVVLDARTSDALARKRYWEEIYGIVEPKPLKKSSQHVDNRKSNSRNKISMENNDAKTEFTQRNSSRKNTDSK